ncbi:SMP-30/gluconolactonase/LRE family protein [Hoeflea poritis]|uniref:SMP-30/gluconolactonase/LRE family protein n=1 Tax=Hoeflea poritis TaxID=2993659 RepID=A0ABT4VPH9_9HYPH|nr:SMP-30/gluconolactonase/LRE family protein [Hoeflea poritis]MDA4846617.1 SMP-30/gluconolactonase/LRE family protein [Hoeflea poritis]
MQDHIVVDDRRFLSLIQPNAHLEKIAGGMIWTEGPVYFPQGDYFLWSDIPNNRSYQWSSGSSVRVFDHNPNYCNGHTRDREGRLISCEHLTRRVTRLEHGGSVTVIADSFNGKRLNSPNDVVVKSDGSIWFTDPPYGILSDFEGAAAEQEQDGCYVFRWCPDTGELSVVADDFVKPNGLAFSPDESLLYVSDTGLSHDPDGPHHIRVFDVKDGRALANGRIFVDIEEGVPDGFRADCQGNIWTSSAAGVQCFDPDAMRLGMLATPETVANVTFGGRRNIRLLITATTSVYTTFVSVKGAT